MTKNCAHISSTQSLVATKRLGLSSEKTKKTLSEIAYARIKELILTEELLPGTILSISEIALNLEMSRTPVNAACQILAEKGLLKIIPKRGVMVAPLSVEDAREIYDARTAIETYVIDKIFGTLDCRDFDKLDNALQIQHQAIHEDDPHKFMIWDIELHSYLMGQYGNQLLVSIWENLFDRMFYVGLNNCRKPERMQESLGEHKDLIRQLKSGDRQAAIESIRRNMENAYRRWCL